MWIPVTIQALGEFLVYEFSMWSVMAFGTLHYILVFFGMAVRTGLFMVLGLCGCQVRSLLVMTCCTELVGHITIGDFLGTMRLMAFRTVRNLHIVSMGIMTVKAV